MTQPEALRLAAVPICDRSITWQSQATIELRRLHAENDALRGANNAFGQRQEWWNERMFVLEQQRDELLEALKEMLAVWEEDPAYGHASAEKARAAIAKAQQQSLAC